MNMRGSYMVAALLAIVVASPSLAASTTTSANILSNPNASRRLTSQPAPLATTQSTTTVRRDRNAEIERIMNTIEERRRSQPVSP
jgi:hypothetical protein